MLGPLKWLLSTCLSTFRKPLTPLIVTKNRKCNKFIWPMHSVSFDWLLYSLDWNLNLVFCLLKLMIFHQKLLWNIRSRLNSSTFLVNRIHVNSTSTNTNRHNICTRCQFSRREPWIETNKHCQFFQFLLVNSFSKLRKSSLVRPVIFICFLFQFFILCKSAVETFFFCPCSWFLNFRIKDQYLN